MARVKNLFFVCKAYEDGYGGDEDDCYSVTQHVLLYIID